MSHLLRALAFSRALRTYGVSLMLLVLSALALATQARAQIIYGLGTITGPNIRRSPVGSQGLILINPSNGSTSTLVPVAISGIPAGQTLVGIDYRSVNNLLYALGYDAMTAGNNTQLFILDPGTNTVTPVGAAIRLELGGPNDRIGFDFIPTVDRIRVVSSNRNNFRLFPTSGTVAFTDGLLTYASGTPATPGVGTAAYTNPFMGSSSTTLYDLDYLNAPNNGLLSIQDPPNFGTLSLPKTVMFQGRSGNYGVGSPLYLGLDIYFNVGSGQNVGYLTEVTARDLNNQSSSNTYQLDLNTGQATLLGNTVPKYYNFEIRDMAVAIGPRPLPVVLSAFAATPVNAAAVCLAWATASEQHSARFEVERSTDGVAFVLLATVAAAGSSSTPHRYRLTDDRLPAGVSRLYYRLRQVDMDGSHAFSPVRSVALVGPAVAPQVRVYPNPARDAAQVRLLGPASMAPLELFDAVGRRVRAQTAPLPGTTTPLSLVGLPSGVYVVRCGRLSQRLAVE